MSQAIASARNRRAFNVPSTAQQGSFPEPVSTRQVGSSVQTTANVNAPGLTLPQVIALVDKRLIALETFVKDQSTGTLKDTSVAATAPSESAISDVLDEFNHRFEILAQELDSMKDIIIKLQSYTMDVNKMLVDERVHVFSELGNNSSALQTQYEDGSIEVLVQSENIRIELEESVVDTIVPTSVDLRDLVKEEFSISRA